ncbi:MAG: peptidoglycan glycosyltransferase, partial [Lachnospiraceae bacterium]|nr:peptidoglycan glycosyltransferase [Lachnospiraceae bacterium]
PAGYAIGGKTGTAEMVPRDHTNYVVSFMGFAPADDPQIVIYCVVDRPNVSDQAHATYATGIVKNILTEVLPYLHIAKTEEMTIAEQEEVDNILGNIVQSDTTGNDGEGEDAKEGGDGEGSDSPDKENEDGENMQDVMGAAYVVDPVTGELVDPVTGEKAQMDYSTEDDDGIPLGDNSDNPVQD